MGRNLEVVDRRFQISGFVETVLSCKKKDQLANLCKFLSCRMSNFSYERLTGVVSLWKLMVTHPFFHICLFKKCEYLNSNTNSMNNDISILYSKSHLAV
jgi:hypothetical protein